MTTRNIAIGGEVIKVSHAMKLVDFLYDHAYQLAGQFYENDRSDKFRTNWPSAYDFADANKLAFVQQARADFAAMLGNPKTPPETARRIHLALLVERAFSAGLEQLGKEADTQLQVMRDSQQFIGDQAENRKTMEKFGPARNFRALLKSSAAKLSETFH